MTTAPRKRIIIAGGVAGGMSCATRLRRLDEHAEITVLEKGPFVSYANCGIPYALGNVIDGEAKLLVQTPEKIHSWFNVDVRINTELLSINRTSKTVKIRKTETGEEETLPYDKLVLALGAEPVNPPIEGVKLPHVFHLTTIADLRGIEDYVKSMNPHSAAVIGGAFIGLEAVENLRALGLKEVSVVERSPHVFPETTDPDMAYPLGKELKKHDVKLYTNANVVKLEPGFVHVEGRENPVPADLVIMAAGVRPRVAIPREAGLEIGTSRARALRVNEHMQTSDPDIYAVGDMVETPHRVLGKPTELALAGPANRQGRLVADHICGKKGSTVNYRGNIGTSVCKVFDQTIGTVGLSEAHLDRAGIRHNSVTVHPVNHAGYYPGSTRLIMKVHFDHETGAILGGQVVGPDSVDKQMDVLAVAMTAGMTVQDLEHLELAYAPPYGAAKDAVNMAGFVAGNVMRGDLKTVHASDFTSTDVKPAKLHLDDFLVLDVRSPHEFGTGHIAGAVNIPIGDLRGSIADGELDEYRGKDSHKTIITYCAVGYRGYLAYRILQQDGFERVANLDGGLRAVTEGGFDMSLQRIQL